MRTDQDHLHVEKVIGGDKEAFRYFINQYQNMAMRIALSMVQDDDQARQIVQNAFIRAYKGLPKFEQRAQFSTWFYRIVVNESIKHSRIRKIDQQIVPITTDNTISLQIKNTALDSMELKEKRQQIKVALTSMKPKERLMIELFYLQELSIMEIVDATGFTSSNVKVLLHRARKSFANLFTHSE